MVRRHSARHLDDRSLGCGIQEAGVSAQYCNGLLAEVAGREGLEDVRPLTEDMLMIDPRPCFLISGIA